MTKETMTRRLIAQTQNATSCRRRSCPTIPVKDQGLCTARCLYDADAVVVPTEKENMAYEGSSYRPASPGNPMYHWRCRDFTRFFLQFPRGPQKVIIREYRATKMTLVWFPVRGKRGRGNACREHPRWQGWVPERDEK